MRLVYKKFKSNSKPPQDRIHERQHGNVYENKTVSTQRVRPGLYATFYTYKKKTEHLKYK